LLHRCRLRSCFLFSRSLRFWALQSRTDLSILLLPRLLLSCINLILLPLIYHNGTGISLRPSRLALLKLHTASRRHTSKYRGFRPRSYPACFLSSRICCCCLLFPRSFRTTGLCSILNRLFDNQNCPNQTDRLLDFPLHPNLYLLPPSCPSL